MQGDTGDHGRGIELRIQQVRIAHGKRCSSAGCWISCVRLDRIDVAQLLLIGEYVPSIVQAAGPIARFPGSWHGPVPDLPLCGRTWG